MLSGVSMDLSVLLLDAMLCGYRGGGKFDYRLCAGDGY